jgi:fatty acid desaturase
MQEIETKAASALAWFAAKVALGAVAVNYILGPVVAIVFLAGLWWGVRNHPEEEVQ